MAGTEEAKPSSDGKRDGAQKAVGQMEALSDLLAHARGTKVNKACSILRIISSAPNDVAPNLLKFVAEQFAAVESKSSDIVSLDAVIPDNELPALRRQYGEVGDAMLKSLISENADAATFYERLWQLVNNPFFPDERVRGFQLFNMLVDARIPYFQIPTDLLNMDSEEYLIRITNLEKKLSIAKVRFLLTQEYSQKTQRGDLLIRHINSENDNRDRAILMCSLIEHFENVISRIANASGRFE